MTRLEIAAMFKAASISGPEGYAVWSPEAALAEADALIAAELATRPVAEVAEDQDNERVHGPSIFSETCGVPGLWSELVNSGWVKNTPVIQRSTTNGNTVHIHDMGQSEFHAWSNGARLGGNTLAECIASANKYAEANGGWE